MRNLISGGALRGKCSVLLCCGGNRDEERGQREEDSLHGVGWENPAGVTENKVTCYR